MLSMSEGALEVLYSSAHIAVDFGHSYYGHESVLLALVENEFIAQILEAHGVNLEELEENLRKHMDQHYPKFDMSKMPANLTTQTAKDRFLEDAVNAHAHTQDVVKIVGRAALSVAQELDAPEVKVEHFLLALLQLEDTAAYRMLADFGLNFEAMKDYLQTGTGF